MGPLSVRAQRAQPRSRSLNGRVCGKNPTRPTPRTPARAEAVPSVRIQSTERPQPASICLRPETAQDDLVPVQKRHEKQHEKRHESRAAPHQHRRSEGGWEVEAHDSPESTRSDTP
ncbi:hypothetical protein HETIRDRAFT_106359 [Heterobasidion irregulare TC 32-1]|uniref:Uncharacterized protein n=1 Tax=Heterobasidion irregulare (strain TC 32-1) TaxID=747525 RepID=W4JRG9_HETIT|nr:uncharacterized protein HETIRDRAFT_106359 [Heterobasidion irregulare TC 32-1]ETW75680.1 hypothetical protein HETIRDRAFT_106359 [Heterobasidion irregulare TC 32-1]